MFCPSRCRSRSCSPGFSLVEVAIATAIIAVALVTFIGLLPSGTSQFQRAMDVSITAQIAQRILSDAEQAEFDALIDKASLPPDPEKLSYCPAHFTFRAPRASAPAWRYFDVQGGEVIPVSPGQLTDEERQKIVYHVNIRIRPRAPMPNQSERSESSAQVAQITVQIIRNPAHMPLTMAEGNADDPNRPERNLIAQTRFPIYTYAALVGRNHGR